MRIAYGFCRHESDFDGLNVDRIWIDGKNTDRLNRSEMLKNGGVRNGDTLVLLSRADLSFGKHITALEAQIKGMGVEIEINEPAKERKRPGPPSAWTPSDDDRFRKMWKDLTLHGPYVEKMACKDAGLEPTQQNRKLMRSRLVRRYGLRSK